MDGILIHNSGKIRCSLRVPVRAFASDPGYPNVPAVRDPYGLGQVSTVLGPGAAASMILADTHSCGQRDSHRYHHMTLRLGNGEYSVYLPDTTTSSDYGRRSLAVSRRCPPLVSGFLPPIRPVRG